MLLLLLHSRHDLWAAASAVRKQGGEESVLPWLLAWAETGKASQPASLPQRRAILCAPAAIAVLWGRQRAAGPAAGDAVQDATGGPLAGG